MVIIYCVSGTAWLTFIDLGSDELIDHSLAL